MQWQPSRVFDVVWDGVRRDINASNLVSDSPVPAPIMPGGKMDQESGLSLAVSAAPRTLKVCNINGLPKYALGPIAEVKEYVFGPDVQVLNTRRHSHARSGRFGSCGGGCWHRFRQRQCSPFPKYHSRADSTGGGA